MRTPPARDPVADDVTGGEDVSSRTDRLRLVALVLAFTAASVALHLSGWSGPERLQALVESAGWAGAAVFVVGYAVLVLVPSPASVLTILSGVLFGLWWGTLLAWAGALLGAFGGFLLGRRLGRPAVDRMLRGRLQDADKVLARHGLVAVVAVRLLPLFPFTPINYASGLLGVRLRDYVLGTAVGIVPGALAYAAVGASGADPRGIVIGVGGLLVLTLLGGAIGRRLLATSTSRLIRLMIAHRRGLTTGARVPALRARLRSIIELTEPVHPATLAAVRRRWSELPTTARTAATDVGPRRRGVRGHARSLPEVQPHLFSVLPLRGRQQGPHGRHPHTRPGPAPDGAAAGATRPTCPRPAHRR